jgi:transposase
MSKHQVAVLKVVSQQLSVTAAAGQCGMSRGHLHRLLRRYREGGLDALEPRSRRPLTNPGRTPDAVRARIVELRTELTAHGFDAGPVTIAWHLGREGLTAPSTSTIRRILHAAGLVVPRATQAPAQLVDPLRGLGAQRAVAVRLHPLVARRRQRGRDHQLAR